MQEQEPAEGILKQKQFENGALYYVPCDCMDPDHYHSIDVEVDDQTVTVHLYTRATTPFWKKGRLRQLWEIISKGYCEYESSVILSKQQAYNYANTLSKACNQSNNKEKQHE